MKRERVLPPGAIKYGLSLAKSKRKAMAFLIRAGIITKAGKLHRNYR